LFVFYYFVFLLPLFFLSFADVKVSLNVEVNKMTDHNLAIVFAPNILRPKVESHLTLLSMFVSFHYIIYIILYFAFFFVFRLLFLFSNLECISDFRLVVSFSLLADSGHASAVIQTMISEVHEVFFGDPIDIKMENKDVCRRIC
jgi:hypothetical protein